MAGTGYQVWIVMSDWTAWGAHKITAPEGAAFVVPDYMIVGLGHMAGRWPVWQAVGLVLRPVPGPGPRPRPGPIRRFQGC